MKHLRIIIAISITFNFSCKSGKPKSINSLKSDDRPYFENSMGTLFTLVKNSRSDIFKESMDMIFAVASDLEATEFEQNENLIVIDRLTKQSNYLSNEWKTTLGRVQSFESFPDIKKIDFTHFRLMQERLQNANNALKEKKLWPQSF